MNPACSNGLEAAGPIPVDGCGPYTATIQARNHRGVPQVCPLSHTARGTVARATRVPVRSRHLSAPASVAALGAVRFFTERTYRVTAVLAAPCATSHEPERRREAHVSAKQPPPKPQARVPLAHADQGRTSHRQEPSESRPGQALGVTEVASPHGAIRSGRDIAHVVRSPRQRAGRLAVVHGLVRDEAGPPRVAVIASRRVGGAVQRNRAKRLLREAARQLPLRPSVDLVLVARPSCLRHRMPVVHAEVARLAGELDLLEVPAGARR